MRHNQNRRSRGRSRKGPNPLTRSYESNGPDVKVRGTAAHVAEKYSTLARDALAAGDTVSAENYLQHAEHYNRIVAAAQQAQFQQAQQAQQRDGADDERVEERAPKGLRGEDRGQPDDQPGSLTESGDAGDNAVLAEAEQDAAVEGDGEARRARRPRRSRAGAGSEGSAGTASREPDASMSGDGDAAAADAPKPNGRRRRPTADEAAADNTEETATAQSDGDATSDGAAALAAFPE